MATWIGAQQQRLLASHQGSLGVGSMTTLHVASADHYSAVRLMGLSLHSSYSVLTQMAQDSGTWIVSTLQAFSIGSGQALEFKTFGREVLFTITNGASASLLRAFAHAVPIA
jgi:hypothetical protein